jgi:hypothetical protein
MEDQLRESSGRSTKAKAIDLSESGEVNMKKYHGIFSAIVVAAIAAVGYNAIFGDFFMEQRCRLLIPYIYFTSIFMV